MIYKVRSVTPGMCHPEMPHANGSCMLAVAKSGKDLGPGIFFGSPSGNSGSPIGYMIFWYFRCISRMMFNCPTAPVGTTNNAGSLKVALLQSQESHHNGGEVTQGFPKTTKVHVIALQLFRSQLRYLLGDISDILLPSGRKESHECSLGHCSCLVLGGGSQGPSWSSPAKVRI